MERYLARAVHRSTVYTGTRNESVIHHLEIEYGAGWWGAKILCSGQSLAGGQISKTKWNELPFIEGEDVTCLTCLVNAALWSS
jgi:hypothetical protein